MKELIITIVALLSWIFVLYALGKINPTCSRSCGGKKSHIK